MAETLKDLLAAAGEALYGERWQSPLAQALAVDDSRLPEWMEDERSAPPGIRADLAGLCRARQAALADLAFRLETEALQDARSPDAVQPAQARLSIPAGIAFSDLNLARGTSGVLYRRAVLARVCEASGIELGDILFDDGNAAALIGAWYRRHLAAGGERNPIADGLLQEQETTPSDVGTNFNEIYEDDSDAHAR